MKKITAILLAALMVAGMTACGGNQSPAPSTAAPAGDAPAASDAPAPAEGKKLKIGVVLSTGGLGDKNFNDMTYDGMMKAQEDFGIEFDYVESKAVSDFVPNYRMFAETEEYDLIIGLANDQVEAVKEIGLDFPDQKISLIDADLEQGNVSATYTKWQEQTFLTGVVAGLGTKSAMDKANAENVVGVILGKEAPNLRQGVVGFMAGVRYVNPDAEILEAVVDNFNDPGKGKEIALSMYNRGADFIQHIAGASGLGVFNAAKETGRYAFGVGGNQNANEPDYVVATALRNVNEMVYNEVKALVEGTWAQGVHISGIKEGAVGFDAAGSNVTLPDDIQAAVDDIKAKVSNGELSPCDDAAKLEEWVKANQYTK